jgi:iron(III) transport system ATP-binding protein
MTAAIELRSLSKSDGGATVLDGLELSVAAGEAVAVVGPSGCGKTTLLRLIAGLEAPDDGEIHLAGRLVGRPGYSEAPHRRNVSFVFQVPALWPHMTVLQNVLFGLHRWPRHEAMARATDLLARMGLEELSRRYPDELSTGQSRRVALARSLAVRARCILLDEPFTNVDMALKQRLFDLIVEESEGTTVLLVTHEHGEAQRLTTRVLTMVDGRLAGPSPDGGHPSPQAPRSEATT